MRAWRASLILGPSNGAGLRRDHGGAAASSYTVKAKPRQSSKEQDKQLSGWLILSFTVIYISYMSLLHS